MYVTGDYEGEMFVIVCLLLNHYTFPILRYGGIVHNGGASLSDGYNVSVAGTILLLF